jgi:predicted enzyme related to lactoylglutathione lyase
MSERNHYPPGVPCWVDTLQPDPEAATRFYAELFGWEFVRPGAMPGEPPGRYFVAQLRGKEVAGVGSTPSQGPPPAWNTYVSVTSADEAAERATRGGGTVIVAAFDAPPAGRLAVLGDPAGAVICIWESLHRQGAQLVNEPSAWALSLLHSADPDGAKAFYAEVFGWESEPFAIGEGEITLWRLPGYVGGQPEQPAPRDVVGVMLPLDDDAPPHWSVDFWIDDADAAAAKAPSLGGKVVVPPYDSPGFRSAVLADPQGAVFSVSKLIAAGQ